VKKEASVAAKETTDITLFVRTSDEEIAHWDRKRIVDALMLETYVDPDTAEAISLDVEKQIMASGLTYLTAPLIRELVDAKLMERGLEQARRMHTRLGFPLYDVSQIILHQNKENANLPHGPEASNLILAEGIKKEYALHGVFSQDIGDAHVRGDLHLHDLGYIDRPYSSSQTLEFVKKFGLYLPNPFSASKPARHAEVLLAHMVRYSAVLQGYFSGTVGWDAVNVFFAPYLEKLSGREIGQIAQMLVFEFSQLAVSRGGQAIFTEIGIYWEIPRHLRDVPAIGPGGEFTGKTYGYYAKDAQRFARALFDIYREGDALGSPFFFPKPLLRITEDFFETTGHEDFLLHVCEVAAEKGNPHFVFDRNQTLKALRCCRLDFPGDRRAQEEARNPWQMRYASIQNVTLNLPRLGYLAEGNDTRLFSLISERMEIVAKAHVQKRQFIEKLLALGDGGPLALLSMDCEGSAYLKLDQATCLIGMVGLNELVQIHRNSQLHENDTALRFGISVLGYMLKMAAKLSRKHSMRFILEQTPAESTAYRFARLDLKYHSPPSGRLVRGDIVRGELYYTNSTQLNIAAKTDPFTRVKSEGHFHPLIDGNAISSIWLGESKPDASELARFVTRAFHETASSQIVFSPEFTVCFACRRTVRGLKPSCPDCGSARVEGISRVGGYLTHTSRLNRGKVAELRDTFRASTLA
jgi:anaerobic ribonucleoside-triphosphate reductase